MNYSSSLQLAIRYIEQHLKEDMELEEVAREAGYSYYHLTRQFYAVLGESVGSYIRCRRLAEAAKELIHTDRRILDIAVDYGFGSCAAFNHAFKAVYQLSPTAYRKRQITPFISNKPALNMDEIKYLTHGITVHPRIEILPDILVAGLRGETTLENNKLPTLWNDLRSRVELIPDRVLSQTRGFGICEACTEGNSLYQMNDKIVFTEVAGVEVTSLEHILPPFTGKVLQGGAYAVFTHTGSLRFLTKSFQYIWGTWFLTTEEELDEREDFELYDERFTGYDDPDSQIDLYIPVKQRIQERTLPDLS